MTDDIIMACGCVANAKEVQPDGSTKPACVIHNCSEVTPTQPSIEGREAQCTSCQAIVPSAFNLAFFQYKGPGSQWGRETCKMCQFLKRAHETGRVTDHEFVPQPEGAQYDSFYCGCRGWD